MITTDTKHKHTITSQIPKNLWSKIFRYRFDETTLDIEGKDFSQVFRTNLPEDSAQALILLILNYPKIPLMRILNFLNLDFSNLELLEIIGTLSVSVGRIDILQSVKEQVPTRLKWLLELHDYTLFREACTYGRADILEWLSDQDAMQLSNVIKINNHKMFRIACSQGHTHILESFKKLLNPEEFHQMLISHANTALLKAAPNSKLDILKWCQHELSADDFNRVFSNILDGTITLPILQWFLDSQKKETLQSVFVKAFTGTHFQVECIAWLANQIPKDQWIDRMRSKNYKCFSNITLDVFKWLESYESSEIVNLVNTRGDDFIFSTNTCLDFIERIHKHLTKDQFKSFIEKHAEAIFNDALHPNGIERNKLGLLKFLNDQNPELFKKLLQKNNYTTICRYHYSQQDYVFQNDPDSEIIPWIMAKLPEVLVPLIEAAKKNKSELFASIQNPSFFKTLEQQLSKNDFARFMTLNQEQIFKQAYQSQNLDLLEWIAMQSNQSSTMIKDRSSDVMKVAAVRGNIHLIEWLRKHLPKTNWKAIVLDSEIFKTAIMHNNTEVMTYIAKQEAAHEVDWARRYRDLSDYNYIYSIETLIWFKEKIAPEAWLPLLRTDNYSVFHTFFTMSTQSSQEFLLQFPEEEHAAILQSIPLNVLYHQCSRIQADSKRMLTAVVQRLQWIMQYPDHFANIEEHGFSNVVNPFVSSMLYKLHHERDTLIARNPNGVFDITDPQRARLCFYMLRNIIRRKDPLLDESLHFLINIPSVKALLHREVTPGVSNELLRLAMSVNNVNASTLLLNIPAVRELAAANNYYQREQRDGVDLGDLARNRESSMTALTQGEANRLDAVIKRYLPEIKRLGGKTCVMEDLKQRLTKRYEKNPATITKDSKTIVLPLDFNTFNALKQTEKLTDSEWDAACKAYYTHPDHTAWRYLSKPNPWMHQDASFVYINDARTERWSTFEEYVDMISLFYLAATDKDMPSTDDREKTTPEKTVETRFGLFINELACIGRAHNWDKTRERDGKREEYDDMEGDRPSCNIGVKRRLFQSVIGHPLLQVLTEEQIDAEIRRFIVGHFQSVLKTVDPHEVESILDKLYGETEEEAKKAIPAIETLAKFNISDVQQEAFIKKVSQKYGAQFDVNPIFKERIQNRFQLDSSPFESQYHVTKLAMLFELYTYLANKHAHSDNASTDTSVVLDTGKNTEPTQTTPIPEPLPEPIPKTPMPPKTLDLRKYQKQYDAQVKRLVTIQKELGENLDVIGTLCIELEQSRGFFENKTTLAQDEILAFKTKISTAFDDVQNALNTSGHKDLWFQIHPILRAILGVISALLIIPAVVVSLATEKGFRNTFFGESHQEQVAKLKAQVVDDLDEMEQNMIPKRSS